MNLLLVSATPFEIAPLMQWLGREFQAEEGGAFKKNDLSVRPLVTGVGLTATAFHLGYYLAHNKPDFALNAGIAGAFDREIAIGEVRYIQEETFADLGVEDANGQFLSTFDLKLDDPDQYPFSGGKMMNPHAEFAGFLPRAQAISVHKAHGSARSIEEIGRIYPGAQLESMEGAAFFYACLQTETPFAEIRAVSNYVEPRNRDNWNIPLALENLNGVLVQMLQALSGNQP